MHGDGPYCYLKNAGFEPSPKNNLAYCQVDVGGLTYVKSQSVRPFSGVGVSESFSPANRGVLSKLRTAVRRPRLQPCMPDGVTSALIFLGEEFACPGQSAAVC